MQRLLSLERYIRPAATTATATIEGAESVQAFYAENVWPAHPAGLRRSMEAVYRDCTRLANTLLRVFACVLQEDEAFFRDCCDAHTSNLQVANYSSLVVPAGSVLRKRAHADSGTLTILASDDWTSSAAAPVVRPLQWAMTIGKT